MAMSKICYIFFAFLMFIGSPIFTNQAVLATDNNDCLSDITRIKEHCFSYIQIIGPDVLPSSECCDIIRGVDVACICKSATDEIKQTISMSRFGLVARLCGNPGKCL
ncbi:hypothetical protein AQUCO_01400683v1 [Aquilegia coerulea]|uniref:Bifunctional inhibitor/plant lipid transfer protein/seed storage helical domain-containing protein n=1 Tax=Aquilegia coerulea TaxID=218851 RepID=A0A2G5DXL1_AQUCA|nr:hypothetical protein AQUCO_01400683v1 [Aquilegia coerulea]